MTYEEYQSFKDWVNQVNCCGPSPAQSFLVLSPAGLLILFYFLMTPRVMRPNYFWIIYTNSVCTSQGTHYVSSTKTYWLMLVRGKNRCLLVEIYRRHKYNLWAECRVSGC
jgi:hypothetical protein